MLAPTGLTSAGPGERRGSRASQDPNSFTGRCNSASICTRCSALPLHLSHDLSQCHPLKTSRQRNWSHLPTLFLAATTYYQIISSATWLSSPPVVLSPGACMCPHPSQAAQEVSCMGLCTQERRTKWRRVRTGLVPDTELAGTAFSAVLRTLRPLGKLRAVLLMPRVGPSHVPTTLRSCITAVPTVLYCSYLLLGCLSQ